MRLRICFAKHGKVRWTSHRDAARIWERALRRAGLPVAYTEGFSPRPKLSFGLALSTGHESEAEYLDVDLVPGTAPDLEDLRVLLASCLPSGFAVVAVAAVPPGTPSLQQAVTSCTWQLDVAGVTLGDATRAVATALAAPALEISRSRKGVDSVDDVRPAIVDLGIVGETVGDDGERLVRLEAELATGGRSLRPAELLAAVLPAAEERRVVRLGQWVDAGGRRGTPMPVPPAVGVAPCQEVTTA